MPVEMYVMEPMLSPNAGIALSKVTHRNLANPAPTASRKLDALAPAVSPTPPNTMTTFVALTCPQCAGTLPKQARWRMATCPHCGSTVTKATNLVDAAEFHEAHARAYAVFAGMSEQIRLRGQRYQILAQIGAGSACDVFLAQRLAPAGERVVVKLARDAGGEIKLQREAAVFTELQALKVAGAAYFTHQLPQLVAVGVTDVSPGFERFVLVRRHVAGYWGSLADVRRNAPMGIAPHHVVWVWRRALATLGFIHGAGWTHGDVSLEHLLVQPCDHGGMLIDWSSAAPVVNRVLEGKLLSSSTVARDLVQLAWSMRQLLSTETGLPSIPANVPAPLAKLLARCSEDANWGANLHAHGIDRLLLEAGRESFGAPQFMPFDPYSPSI